jgi:hypothetical protein
MKQIFIAIITTVFLTSCIGAGDISDVKSNGKGYFPSMVGIDLIGEQRKVPESFESEYNIVAVAFEREHQTDVNSWITVADKILAKNSNIKFYEIPLIYEMYGPYRFWVNNGMRSGIPDLKARLRTITVYTEREKFLRLMNMESDGIYLLLLDKKGKVLWQTEGPSDDGKIIELENAIKALN